MKKILKTIITATLMISGIYLFKTQVANATDLNKITRNFNDVEVGVQNLNNSDQNSARIGDYLPHPERGWRRYDDTNVNVKYIGTHWCFPPQLEPNYANLYNGTQSYSQDKGNEVQFSIIGSKLRLIEHLIENSTNSTENTHDVYADGAYIGSINNLSDDSSVQILTFEHQFKNYGKHNITIVHTNNIVRDDTIIQTVPISIDAIDTDGELVNSDSSTLNKEIVENLFKIILQRPSDKSGLDFWTNKAKNDGLATVISGIINSDEANNHHYSSIELVNILYKTMYGRNADSDGLIFWSNQLDKGLPINSLINKLAESNEFKNTCSKYNLKSTPINLTDICDKNPDVAIYINELYRIILNRKPDPDGLRDKIDRITVRHFAPGEVIKMMFDSEEFKLRHINNNDFVTMAFRSILGREPDKAGYDYWTNFLKNNSRQELIDRFLDSPEYKNLIKDKIK